MSQNDMAVFEAIGRESPSCFRALVDLLSTQKPEFGEISLRFQKGKLDLVKRMDSFK